MNLLDGDGRRRRRDARRARPCRCDPTSGAAADVADAVTIGVRPEGMARRPTTAGSTSTVDVVEELGSESFLYCATSTADDLPGRRPHRGAQLRCSTATRSRCARNLAAVHLFDTATGPRACPTE